MKQLLLIAALSALPFACIRRVAEPATRSQLHSLASDVGRLQAEIIQLKIRNVELTKQDIFLEAYSDSLFFRVFVLRTEVDSIKALPVVDYQLRQVREGEIKRKPNGDWHILRLHKQ